MRNVVRIIVHEQWVWQNVHLIVDLKVVLVFDKMKQGLDELRNCEGIFFGSKKFLHESQKYGLREILDFLHFAFPFQHIINAMILLFYFVKFIFFLVNFSHYFVVSRSLDFALIELGNHQAFKNFEQLVVKLSILRVENSFKLDVLSLESLIFLLFLSDLGLQEEFFFLQIIKLHV
jgi:hypothetical protein